MDAETIITIKIKTTDEGIVVTAVQSATGEEQILAIPSLEAASEPAGVDLPPPPELEAFESMAEEAQLPPVPVVEEIAAFESWETPELPPVPELPDPEIFEAYESMAVPNLPPVPEAPQGELFE